MVSTPSASTFEGDGNMFSSYAGRGTSSLQSSGGELDHPPSSARSSSTKISGGDSTFAHDLVVMYIHHHMLNTNLHSYL